MAASNDASLQDRLGEELGLLPGRISRTFFLLATLDAQASRVRNDLQHTRVQLLENLSSNAAPADSSTATIATASASQQLSALRQLHQVQRQLLADKLFVDKKASEWLARAKNVVNRYSQESRKRFRSSSGGFHSPHLDAGQRTSLSNGLAPPETSGLIDGRQRTRLSTTLIDDAQDYAADAFGPYGLRAPVNEASSSIAGGMHHPKRRRISGSGDFVAPPGRPPHRRSEGVSHGGPGRKSGAASRVSTGEVGRPPKSKLPKFDASQLAAGATFTIKLGSQQKGRPRKSAPAVNNKNGAAQGATLGLEAGVGIVNGAAAAASASLQQPPIVYETTEEYFCPICNKSDYEDPAMVACDQCDKWYHCVCVGFQDLADAESTKQFYCPTCVSKKARGSETAVAAAIGEAPSPAPDESDDY